MNAKLSTTLLFCLVSSCLIGQNEPSYSLASLYAGYGSHGFNGRLDLEISDKYFNGSSTRFHLELGGQRISFDDPDYNFEGQQYPSDSRVMSLGAGVGQEFHFASFVTITPFAGLRAEFVRFQDRALIDAIGENGIIRYYNGVQVGPSVESAYGDAATIDVGGRIGFQLAPQFEVAGTIGVSPIKFDTATTLFGQYRGEAPYPNSFYVERKPIRFEVGLRYLL